VAPSLGPLPQHFVFVYVLFYYANIVYSVTARTAALRVHSIVVLQCTVDCNGEA
jgi:hypothetical protein